MLKVSTDDLIQQVAIRFDLTSFDNPSKTDIAALLQASVNKYWDLIADSAPPRKFSKDYTLTTVIGQVPYDLESLIPDFRSLQHVFVIEDASTQRFREITQLPQTRRNHVEAPRDTPSCLVRYMPTPPILGAPGTAPKNIETVSGWDDFIIEDTCCMLATKERRNGAQHASNRAEAEARIRSALKGLAETGVDYIADVEERDAYYPYYFVTTLKYYDLRGQYLDLYSARVFW